LIIDGAWFKKKENCLVVYGDPDLEYVSWWRYSTGERVFEIVEDLRKLKEAGRFVTQRPRLDAGKEPFPTSSINGLEGRFSSFKQHCRQHRGLSKKRREGYIAWYLRVVVNGKPPTRSGY